MRCAESFKFCFKITIILALALHSIVTLYTPTILSLSFNDFRASNRHEKSNLWRTGNWIKQTRRSTSSKRQRWKTKDIPRTLPFYFDFSFFFYVVNKTNECAGNQDRIDDVMESNTNDITKFGVDGKNIRPSTHCLVIIPRTQIGIQIMWFFIGIIIISFTLRREDL